MTDCAREDDVVAFVAGDLSREEASALEVHLDQCDRCRRLASSLARTAPGFAATAAFGEGERLGRYRLVERIGSGGMGDVWSAAPVEDPSARVALKLLPRLEPDALMLFKREFRAVADLSHPNLVALYELGSATVGGTVTYFIAMELVEGEDFLDHVRGDERRLRASLRQVAAGLAALHAAGQIHRDVKPSNVRVTPDGRVVVLDFGLVAPIATHERRIAGTPAYMAPELRAGGPPTVAADCFALGVVLHEALAGSRPTHPPSPPPGAPDLAALCLALLEPDPAARADLGAVAAVVGGASAVSQGELPFVAREVELDRLRHLAADAHAGATRVVEIVGPPGIGKTALLGRALEELRRDALVLAGRCYDRESAPHKAIDPLVDELVLHLVELPPAGRPRPDGIADLVRMFPALGRAFPSTVPAEPAPDPWASRHEAIAALRDLLAALARPRLLVLAVDDWQWGDEDSAALLAELFRGALPRVLLVVVRRADAGLARHGLPTTEVVLAPLSMDASAELARRMLTGSSPAAVAAIARESRGNPLFITELARGRADAPSSLEEAIRLRWAALPVAERRLLAAISVAGRPIDRTVATRAADVGWAEGPLSRLRAERWVAARHACLEVTHDRVREAIYEALPTEQRAALHGRLGHELEAFGELERELLLEHFRRAGDRTRAQRYAEEAARAAMAALAFERAARLYGEAAELSAPGRLAELHVLRAEALGAAGRGVAAAEAFATAARHATADEAIELGRRAAEQLLRCGRIDDGLDVLGSVLAQMGTPLLTRPRAAVCSIAVRRVELAARRALRRHVDVRAEPELLRAVDLSWRVASALGTVDTVRAAALHTRALSLAVRAGDPVRLSRSLASEAVFAATAGPPSRARADHLLALAADSARGVDAPAVLGMLEGAAGLTSYLTGRFRAALARCDAAERLFAASADGSWERQTTRLYALLSLFYLGDLSELCRRVSVQLAEAIDRGDLYASTSIRTALTNVAWLVTGDVDEARRAVEEGEAVWSRRGFHLQHHWSLLSRAQIDLYLGDAEAALARVTARWAELSRSFLTRIQVVAVEALHLRGRTLVAAAVGREAGARLAAAERDARALERQGSEHARGVALLLRAGIAARRGRSDEAARHLVGASRTLLAGDLGLFVWAAERRLAQQAGDEAQVARVDALFHPDGIADPTRFGAMLVPGFDEG